MAGEIVLHHPVGRLLCQMFVLLGVVLELSHELEEVRLVSVDLEVVFIWDHMGIEPLIGVGPALEGD